MANRSTVWVRIVLLPAVFGLLFISGLVAQSSIIIEGIAVESNASVIPDAEFDIKIMRAMKLLKTRAPAEFGALTSVIGKIRASRTSGADFNADIMTIDIAKLTFDASLEWLASVLIHEAEHIRKYKLTGKKFADAHLIRDKKAALQLMIREELDCNAAQLSVLQKIGGTPFEANYLKGQKGDHFDIDKDGDYDEDDYRARKW